MAGFPLGALISAGGSLLGGLFGSRSDRKAQERALAYQHYVNTHGIRMRVADAKAAGIHPLAALGAQLNYATPSVVPGQSSFGDAIGEGAQAIGQAVTEALSERPRLENEEIKSRIKANEAQAMLFAAQSRTALMKAREQETTRAAPEVIVKDGSNRTVTMDVPILGRLTTRGLPSQEVEDEHGDLASILAGIRLLDEWFRQLNALNKGKPHWRGHPSSRGLSIGNF